MEPNQSKRSTKKGSKNVGKFELIVNERKTIVTPMKVGTIFMYSALMMTHGQQIKNLTDEISPLVNVVSYNSKHLFSNMLE